MQNHTAQKLDIKVAHAQRALGRLSHHGKGFGQYLIEHFAQGFFVGLVRLGLVDGTHRIDRRDAEDAPGAHAATRAMLDAWMADGALPGDALAFSPPLIITEAEIDRLFSTIGDALQATE